MNNKEFVEKLKDIATNYKTLYVLGCFGAPLTSKNKKRYTKNNDFNKGRADLINRQSADTFGFDCVCLIKGVLWGWNGDTTANYGGAIYKSNGVPDIGADSIIKKCSNVSTDFSNIKVGELLWMPGHVGVYIGGGLAVECSPKWANKVQVTAANKDVPGYNRRNWSKHGLLPYIEYTANFSEKLPEKQEQNKPVEPRQFYTVVWGDNLTKIAIKFNTTVDALVKLNNIPNPNVIRAGKTIRVK